MSEPQGTPFLVVEGLSKVFGHGPSAVRAVDGVDLEIHSGRTLALVGESGSGKSTTGFCILQLLRPTAGSVKVDGHELVGVRGKKWREIRRDLQIVLQDPYESLDPRMTIGESIVEPLEVHQVGSRRSRAQRVAELLEMVGLDPSMGSRYPASFSGGQRQRVGIARALALEPRLIVCDEAVSALDVSVQAQIINLLRDLQDRLGLSYLFISHDLAVVRAVADDIAVMRQGRIVESGPADRVFDAPESDYTAELIAAVPTFGGRRAADAVTPQKAGIL